MLRVGKSRPVCVSHCGNDNASLSDAEEMKSEHYEKETENPQVIFDDSATLSKVQHLSHMVWDLLMFLPTNFSIRKKLETFGHSEVSILGRK